MKKIKIFQQEIKDNVADRVAAQASIAYCSEITRTERSADSVIPKAIAESKDQLDLYYLESVLVSTGWNKNDDVFLHDSTWAARNTPEDKQFNFMHNENDIIGHIIGSYVVDKNGDKISASEEEYPSNDFDIITQAVIYNSWANEENRQRMEKIIAEIEEGDKWFVSMECLFAGFDYALISEEDKPVLLPRDESTAFLTKHLRSYGGTGEYEGYRLGRALRNIAFSGKGLVSNPANPESVILKPKSTATNISFVATANNNVNFKIGDSQMGDVDKFHAERVQALETELKAAKDEVKEIKSQAEAAKDEEFKAVKAQLEKELQAQADIVKEKEDAIAELNQEIESLKESVEASKALETELKEVKEALAESKMWMEKKKEEEKKMKRKAQLIEAGVEEDKAEETYESFASLEDTAFDAIVQLVATKNGYMEMDKKKNKEDKKDKSEASDELNASDFDNLETSEASLNSDDNTDDEVGKIRASVVEWFETSVSRSKK